MFYCVILETINDLVASKKNVYVYYSHVTVQDWIDSLDTLGKGANKELDAFKTDIYAASPIKGLVLSNIAVNVCTYIYYVITLLLRVLFSTK